MSEITKDLIKFVAEVIVLLIIFTVVFSPEGIASNTFNYLIFAEPIMLQNYIASALTIGSQTKGEFTTNIKLTSGLPHTVKIFFQGGIPYVSVTPANSITRTDFKPFEPTPIITDCIIKEQAVKLPKEGAQQVTIKKVFENEKCKLILTVGVGAIPPEKVLSCSDGTPNQKCSAKNPPKFCEGGILINKCSVCGCLPGGYTCKADEDCELKFYKLTVYTFVDKYSTPIANVPVNVDGNSTATDANGKIEFSVALWLHTISVDEIFGSRELTHYWDNDCDPTNLNYNYDTASNPYSFNVYPRDKTINVLYKVGTQITPFSYAGSTISGKLIDENSQVLFDKTPAHTTCTPDATYVDLPINRNVTLEYFDGAWKNINTINTLNDGSFSYAWTCQPGATKIRASYESVNWIYTNSYQEIAVSCAPPPPQCEGFGGTCLDVADCIPPHSVCNINPLGCIAPTPCCCVCVIPPCFI